MANKQGEPAEAIDEAILTANFENQMKLLLPHIQKSHQQHQQPNKKSSQQHVFSHKSRKFRFGSEGDDQAPKTTPPLASIPGINQRNADSEKKDNSSDSIGSNVIMPPPPLELSNFPQSETVDEARTSMLMSWYMAGYHTGYFEALRKFNK